MSTESRPLQLLDSATGSVSVVGGGSHNQASGSYSAVLGGSFNRAQGVNSIVCGGGGVYNNSPRPNIASGDNSFVGGGTQNSASGNNSTVGGGAYNVASGPGSTIGGGSSALGGNTASGLSSTVGGGSVDSAIGTSSTVSGGFYNTASGSGATVGGGEFNAAQGDRSTVAGGSNNIASGFSSFAAGTWAKSSHNYSFVWSDSNDGFSGYFTSTANNQFLVHARGGVGINTNSPSTALQVAGTIYSTSGGFKFPDGTLQTSAYTTGSTIGGSGTTNYIAKFSSPMAISNSAIYESAGKVGLGTSTPGTALQVVSTDFSQPIIRFGDPAGVGNLVAGGSRVAIATGDGTERLSILQSNGNVGIGTTNPSALLHVNGSAGNNTGVWSNLSDRRLKEDIEPIRNALETVTRLQPISFRWKDKRKDAEFGRVRGLIAQDVEKVIPDWIKTDPDGYKRIEPIGVDALLMEAIKELNSKVMSQAEQIATQRAQIDELKSLVAKLATRKDEGKIQLGQLR